MRNFFEIVVGIVTLWVLFVALVATVITVVRRRWSLLPKLTIAYVAVGITVYKWHVIFGL